MMSLIKVMLPFSLITLLLFSQSLLTSEAAAVDHQGGDGVMTIPFKRLLLSQLAVKTGEKVAEESFFSSLPKKMGVHMRKVRGGKGLTARPQGKTITSSSASRPNLSFFHFASLLACSFFLGLIML